MNNLTLKYLLLGIPVLTMTIISYPLAPFVTLFAHNGWLPSWLQWFQSYDNNLYGGNDWQLDHPKSYFTGWGMTRWLWRNPAGTFSYVVAGVWPEGEVRRQGDPLTTNTPHGHSGCCHTQVDNGWLFNYVRQWGASRKCLRVVVGWKLYYEQDGGVCRKPTDRKAKPAQWVLVAWPLAGYDTTPNTVT